MRILIAEDERITRATTARQLEAWGHTVVAAEDGQSAWEAFCTGGFELVLTDWEMPGLSGLELVQRIREQAGARFVYIIMLTGRTDKSDVVRGIEAGADDFIAKPFDREELRVRLLAGERIVKLEQRLHRQNAEMREAGERMRRDLRAAARVQQALLPAQTLSVPGVRVAWGYVPTDELAGDAIGLHPIGDDYLVAYLLDVSGHGVPAALLSVSAMHALAPVPIESSLLRAPGAVNSARAPAVVTAELNRRFRAEEIDDRFFTATICAINLKTGLLVFSRAGHFPPAILRSGMPLELSDAGGLPVGLMDESVFHDVEVQLSAGDRICLYSDGLIEQLGGDANQQFGAHRLIGVLKDYAALPAHEAVQNTLETVAHWAGGHRFEDDASLVVIDWLGPPNSGGSAPPDAPITGG